MALASQQRFDEQSRTMKLISQGRCLTLLCAAILAADALWDIALSLLNWMQIEGYYFPIVELAILPIKLIILAGLYIGVRWVRTYIAIGLGIATAVLVAFGSYGLTHGYSTFVLGIIAFRALVYGGILGVLTLSRRVSFYYSYYSR